MPRIFFGLLFFIISYKSVQSQQLALFDMYEQGLNLFEAGHYEASAPFFKQSISNERKVAESSFYLALIHLRSNYDPHPLEKFGKFTRSILLRNRAYRNLALHFLLQADYYAAISYAEKVNEGGLTNREQEELIYKKGYAYFKIDRLEKAESILEEVLYFQGSYFGKAHFHMGLIDYQQKDYSSAISHFLEAHTIADMKEYTTPYIAAIYFEQNRYRDLVELLQEEEEKPSYESDFTTLLYLAESRYYLKQYDKAIATYAVLKKNHAEKMEPSTYYRYGQALLKQDRLQESIDQLKVAGLAETAVGQSASFILGQIYVRQENYVFALNAFRQAAGENYNEELRQQAILQTAKLLMKTEQFAEAAEILQGYLQNYSNSEFYQESVELLAEAYLNTSDYQKALQHLEETGVETRGSRQTYQQVSYKLGRQLYNDQRYGEALSVLKKGLRYPVRKDVTAMTFLLVGESQSVLDKYGDAVDSYRQALALSNASEQKERILYGLGYAFFNTEDYDNALSTFRDFISRAAASDPKQKDAMCRIADCYYVEKQFSKARATFKSLTSSSYGDYAHFQLGSIAYLEDDQDEAATQFSKVLGRYPQSAYADNAAFQLGKMQYEQESFDNAVRQFTSFLNRFPNSNIVPYALLHQGLSYSNTGQLENAADSYKRIINRYPGHTTVENALLGLQDLQKKGLKIDDFDQYLARVEVTLGSSGKLTTIEFEQAKTLFFNQQYEKAIATFSRYLEKYPQTAFENEIKYYIADSYYRQKEWMKASDAFAEVAREPSIYLTRSLDKKGKAEVNANEYEHALSTYHRLNRISGSPRDKFNALEGLTTVHFEMNNLDSAVHYANQIEEASWKPAIATHFVNLVKAQAFLQKGYPEKASDLLIRVINNGNDQYAAEAVYLLALLQHEQAQYRSSIETIFDLVGNYAAYSKWTDRGYLLLVDNYLELGELLQAEATLESIEDNAESTFMLKEASQRKEKIRQLQANEVKLESDSTK